jgi:putative ABC transport system permease protein
MTRKLEPPRLANQLFTWYCKNALIEDLEGDLEEMFYKDAETLPLWKAKLRYWKFVLALMFSYSIRKRKKQASYSPFSSTNTLAMFSSYIKVASRSLAKHRFFTIINVLGLAVGMSISLLFIAMISFVSRYDEFHQNKEYIYRVITSTNDKNSIREYASAPVPLAEKLKVDWPGNMEVVRINRTLSGTAITAKKEVPLHGYFADENFLKVFSFPLIKGNIQTALSKPNSVLITEDAAKKTFGEEDAIGQIITLEPWGDLEVTGVLQNIPKTSHLSFEIIGSYSTLLKAVNEKYFKREEWQEFYNNYAYLQISSSDRPETLQKYLDGIIVPVHAKNENLSLHFSLQKLEDIVPGKELFNQIGPEWGYASFAIFGFLTLLILLPACFNYTNISISRTLKRAKEIGLRKTVGGQQSQIFMQFITETIIVTLVALAGAFLIFTQIRSEFLSMLVSSNGLELVADPLTILYFVLFAIVVGVFAGIVPALYFSKLNPVQALKNSAALKSIKGLSFQKILVVSQFALSLGFIMGVVIVLEQYRATLNYDFGFEQSNILDVELQGVDPEQFNTHFSKLSSVQNFSMSSGLVGASSPGETWIKPMDSEDSVVVNEMHIDSRFIGNFNLEVLAGDNFPEFHSGQRERFIIVNEEFIKTFQLGSPRESLEHSFILNDSVEVRIIGVVKNFHYANLREPIRSFVFRNDSRQFNYANLKVASNDMYSALGEMEETWKVFGGETKFRSRFFEDEIKEAYSVYFSLIKICGFMGFLAITISCLGLLGMVVYTAETRMKELGIRKVMGATSYQLAVLLSKSYLKLMVIAAVIATPVTYLLFDKGMLQTQYYRFDIGISEIFISLGIMLALGGGTILSQTIKAAKTNPVDTLKSE